jgi:hypothetical protein
MLERGADASDSSIYADTGAWWSICALVAHGVTIDTNVLVDNVESFLLMLLLDVVPRATASLGKREFCGGAMCRSTTSCCR